MKRLCLLFLTLLLGAALATPLYAVSYNWVGPTGQWNDSTKWDVGATTPGDAAGDYANINTGTCTLNSAPVNPLARVILGASGNGVLSIGAGANLQTAVDNASYVYVGTTDGTNPNSGAVYQSGGTVTLGKTGTGSMRIGQSNLSYGYYSLSGSESALSSTGAPLIGASGIGVFEQTGGTFTAGGTLYVSNAATAKGVLNITGGSTAVNSTTGGLMTGRYTGGFSCVNVSGTGSLSVKYAIDVNAYLGATGIVNVGAVGAGGGTITSYCIRKGAEEGIGIFNFHGGTLKVGDTFAEIIAGTTPASDFITSAVAAYVYGEGAVIDTRGNDAIISAALLAPTDLGVQSIDLPLGNGGMGYIGAPIVTVAADSGTGSGATAIANVDLDPVSGTYGQVTGFTVTNPGFGYKVGETLTATLHGGGYGMMPAIAGTVTLNSGNVSGGLTKLGLGTLTLAGANTYTGATSVQAGGLAVTGSITSDVTVDAAAALSGTGVITGDVDLNGTFSVAYDSDADTIDLLTIAGELDLTGSTIGFSDVGAGTLAQGTYVFAAYGSRVGTAATVTGLQSGWSLDYAYDYSGGTDNSIALIVGPSVQIPGDANGDQKVNDVDAKAVAQYWGTATGATWAMGDFNDDDAVNAADASIMAANWGYGVTEATAGAVPEPSTLAIILAGLFGLAAGANRRRRS